MRYEDLAFQPTSVSREIFDFLDLPSPPNLDYFLRQHTEAKVEKNVKFGTLRQSREVALAWRKTVAPEKAIKVQEGCADAMETLGYNRVEGSWNLKNKDFQLMRPREEVTAVKKS